MGWSATRQVGGRASKGKDTAAGVPRTIWGASLKSVCIKQGRENWKVSGLWGGKPAGKK